MRISFRTAAVVALFVPGVLLAKVGQFPLQEMAEASDLIVVATVLSSPVDAGGLPSSLAVAEVKEVLKGATDSRTLAFVAVPSWECDVAESHTGETVLLFLVEKGYGGYELAYSGRGRMPLRSINGAQYATVWSEVVLPPEWKVLPGPDPQFEFIVSAALTDIKELVRRVK